MFVQKYFDMSNLKYKNMLLDIITHYTIMVILKILPNFAKMIAVKNDC